ncbi:MAG: 3'-5' exonuclease [Clostridia bacterium]|nr:3'-5' exonuclease [Clostridia bacterium]
MRKTLQLRPGVIISAISADTAKAKQYLTRAELKKYHLRSTALPCAFKENEDETVIFYFSPDTVEEADVDDWHFSYQKEQIEVLPSGTVIERMSTRRAASYGFFTKERLSQLHYEAVEEPVGFSLKKDGERVYFYDKKTCIRQPLMCVQCGQHVRYKKKLCESCYEKDLAERRRIGNEYRAQSFGMKREKVLFFDLELTGFYDRDEILSISIIDGTGRIIMNTLVKPTHTQKWKKTEKIHGITPAMVEDAPTLEELIPEIKEIFAGADNIIAYGVSTDYSHIRHIYETAAEQAELKSKIRCCAFEYVRYMHENHPELVHASLTDAMACFEIEWEGVAHSSMADTYGCRKVWERLFPNYYVD